MNLACEVLAGFLVCAVCVFPGSAAMGGTVDTNPKQLQLHVVFNNVPFEAGLETSWGFSCIAEGLDETILFDTGGNGHILLSNIQRLGLDPKSVDVVVLSHSHADHTGGLASFLARNGNVTVFMPESFPSSIKHDCRRHGARLEMIGGPRQLLRHVHTTGEMGTALHEQALIVETQPGLILITGCAHPNVADMAERARAYTGRDIYLVIGGFHLGGSSDAEIKSVIERLQALGVKKVAPSHCTGDNAIQLFRAAWGDGFIDGGLGAVIDVPLLVAEPMPQGQR